MNKSLPVAVGSALILSACAHGPQFKDFGVRIASDAYVSVQVVNDRVIVVSQEPIYVQQQPTNNRIFWSLPSGDTYSFSNTNQDPGIQFDAPHMPNLHCQRNGEDKYTYVCTYNEGRRGKYPYTIRVTKNGTDILKSDPTVMNN